MNTQLRSVVILASVDGFVHSIAETTETSTFVHTSAGIGVEAGDELWRPVREKINGNCYSVHLNEVRKDPDYWDGKARVSQVEIHRDCPGGETRHYCSMAPIPIGVALGMRTKEEVDAWLSTGQFPR